MISVAQRYCVHGVLELQWLFCKTLWFSHLPISQPAMWTAVGSLQVKINQEFLSFPFQTLRPEWPHTTRLSKSSSFFLFCIMFFIWCHLCCLWHNKCWFSTSFVGVGMTFKKMSVASFNMWIIRNRTCHNILSLSCFLLVVKRQMTKYQIAILLCKFDLQYVFWM